MKIFIDTNIFLDLILNRKYSKEATIILNSCDKKLFHGVVADITLLNIDYIASKQTKNLKEFLSIINRTFSVVGANNKVFEKALEIDNDDLEDNIQYVLAKEFNCDVIISNDKSFYNGSVKVLNSKEFIDEYIVSFP